MGGGSWATALAKLLLQNRESIIWYMRRDDRIADFKSEGHNPVYLSDVIFDVDRIEFYSDINKACNEAERIRGIAQLFQGERNVQPLAAHSYVFG